MTLLEELLVLIKAVIECVQLLKQWETKETKLQIIATMRSIRVASTTEGKDAAAKNLADLLARHDPRK